MEQLLDGDFRDSLVPLSYSPISKLRWGLH